MRLIDADALRESLTETLHRCDEWIENAKDEETRTIAESNYTAFLESILRVKDAPTIDAVPIETICEMFGNEAPCNYGLFGVSVDDFMMSKCGKWCEDNCDKVPHTECWQKFFEAIEKWRKQND